MVELKNQYEYISNYTSAGRYNKVTTKHNLVLAHLFDQETAK